jgi:hypothetical protein
MLDTDNSLESQNCGSRMGGWWPIFLLFVKSGKLLGVSKCEFVGGTNKPGKSTKPRARDFAGLFVNKRPETPAVHSCAGPWVLNVGLGPPNDSHFLEQPRIWSPRTL